MLAPPDRRILVATNRSGVELLTGRRIGHPPMMRAMVLETAEQPLRLVERPVPQPNPGQLLIAVAACGVCRTDLHVVDGELPDPKLPLVPGHEIVGRVVEIGAGVTGFAVGDRVGVPWLG